MSSRISFGQSYFNSGDRFFSVNVSDDSPRLTTVICKDGPLYVVQLRDNKVICLSIDGKNIPAENFGQYQAVIDSIKSRLKEQMKRDSAQAERDRQQAGRDREQAERDRLQAERDRQQSMLDREQANRNREQAERDRGQAERDRQQAEQDRQQAVRDREQAERDREQAGRDREQAERDRVRAEEDRRMLDSLIRDLVTDGIVPDKASVRSLKLNSEEISVNGKRLPEALEKKYIARYVKKGLSMSYSND